jgi:hypothetical protein
MSAELMCRCRASRRAFERREEHRFDGYHRQLRTIGTANAVSPEGHFSELGVLRQRDVETPALPMASDRATVKAVAKASCSKNEVARDQVERSAP